MDYYKLFIEAAERTELWGFYPGDITLDLSARYIDEDSQEKLRELFASKYKGANEALQMECTSVSHKMLELVQEHFCTDAYLTTGNVFTGDTSHFECTLDYLKDLAKEKKFKPKLHVHVWITLSSGEIVDFTFLRSMAKAFPYYSSMKEYIVTDLLLEDLGKKYMPMIVGTDFYE